MNEFGRPQNLRDANGKGGLFAGRVAVIVGAGGALGRALAAGLAGLGMKLVLADEDPDALERAADAVQAAGADVLAMVCDVRRRAHVEELADAAMIRFHGIHLLVNGAGIEEGAAAGAAWEVDDHAWDAALGSGLQGSVNAVRVLVPLMLACAARDPGYRGHIVNVAPAELDAPAAMHARGILALSEALRRDLARVGAPIGAQVGVTVLRPDAGIAPAALTEQAIAALLTWRA